MALTDPLQWIVIGVVVIAIFLWGPQKIPELARAFGRARSEFDRASKDAGNALLSGSTSSATSVPERSPDDVLVDTAQALGISTAGKTRDQISQEIIGKSSGR
jgi:sec-independent protein translocase protein TatA